MKGAPRVVAVLAGLLERAAARGDGTGCASSSSSPSTAAFRGRAPPGIPVRRYAERIYRYSGCSPACFVVAYAYLDRLAAGDDEAAGAGAAAVVIDSHTVHRLLITAVMVAAKFMDDRHYNNAYFARVGGVAVPEMNALELRLLFALRFRLNVAPATFARYCATLQAEMLLVDSSSAPDAPPPPQDEEEEEDDDRRRRRDHHRRRRRHQEMQQQGAGSSAAALAPAAAARRLALVAEIAQ